MGDSGGAWAAALYAASAGGDREALAQALEGLSASMARDARIREGLADPWIPRGERIALLESSLSKEAPAETRLLFGRFARLLVEAGRVGLLRRVALSFRSLVDSGEGALRLDIEAANPPGEARVSELAAAWSRAHGGARVIPRVVLRPELLGGYRLRSGSLRLDHSIAGRVESLGRHLSSRPARGPGERTNHG